MLDGPQNIEPPTPSEVVHGEGFSLLQKTMYARYHGEKMITLYVEDAQRELEARQQMDKWLARLMDYAPEDVLEEINKELFGAER